MKELRQRREHDATMYVTEEATTTTRTDTPIRDVPQSIQVITRKVIEEHRAFRNAYRYNLYEAMCLTHLGWPCL